ncbi:MAG: heat-inducible transcription repressor HrcA [Candidatus Riflebacteria bacterium]|nr:heat-inducible transcription repressor HrcA [Candidatus Riflebacteria bacterium]
MSFSVKVKGAAEEQFPVLNDRQKSVLKEVCDSFILTGIPVGSRTISRCGHISRSPATIRNEMADLESMGFLCSPHTSAGRRPTQMGYRFYVNFLLEFERVSQLEEALLGNIAQRFEEDQHQQEKFLRSTMRMTSDLTHLAGVALLPQKSDNSLRSVQLIRLLDDKAMFVMVDECGHISNQVVVIPADTTDDDLQKLTNFMNAELCNRRLSQIDVNLFKKSHEILVQYNSILSTLTERIRSAIQNPLGNAVFLEGFANFFNTGEFKDAEKMRDMITLLDRKEALLNILAESLEKPDEIMVKLGFDSGLAVDDLAVVTAGYQGPNQSFGRIGLIGPIRMDYGRVVGTLAKISKALSDLFMGSEAKNTVKDSR